MPDRALPIGVFDSGVGGLTVLHAMRELLPDEDLVYLGDTARLPYGTKSQASVQRYARHAADFLRASGIKMLVVACNTASALALETLREYVAPLPVIGVVEPGARAAVAGSKAECHLVLATEATTGYRAYTAAIQALDPAAVVEELPCSVFVALAEEGWHSGPVADAAAQAYLTPIIARERELRPDIAILGCTHFPLLQPAIAKALGPDISIVDSASTTAAAVRDELARLDLASSSGGALRLIATEGAGRFARVGGRFLGEDFSPADIEIVDIHPSESRG